MPKNSTCALLLIGLVIMILAGVLIMQANSAHTPGVMHQRLRIQQAVVTLEQQCFTCHSSPLGDFQLIAYAAETGAPLSGNSDLLMRASSSENSYIHAAQPAIGSQLSYLGHRFLEMPDTRGKVYAAAAEGFLQVYEQTQTTTGLESLPDTLEQLRVIEYLLNIAENQAQPVKWIKTNGALSLFESAAPQNIPLPVPALAETRFVRLDMAPESESLTPGDCPHISPQVFFVVNRRGPPVRANNDFAWFRTGRLAIGAQSPFLCIGSDTTIYTSVA